MVLIAWFIIQVKTGAFITYRLRYPSKLYILYSPEDTMDHSL